MLELIQNVIDSKLFDSVNMNANQTSESQSIEGISCYAIEFSWTGFNEDVDARISIQGSNSNSIWSDIDVFTPTEAENSTLINIEKAGYKFVRVVYEQTAGAGTLTAHISGKVI